jgi:hypothetical protein
MADPNAEDDPVELAFLNAPLDDLPESEEERAMVAEARADHAAGIPMISHASVGAVLDERKRRAG